MKLSPMYILNAALFVLACVPFVLGAIVGFLIEAFLFGVEKGRSVIER